MKLRRRICATLTVTVLAWFGLQSNGWAQSGSGFGSGESIESITRKLQKRPNDKQLLCERAYAFMNRGDYAASLKDFDAAEPPDASYETWFYANRANVYVFLKRYKEAVVDCDRALKRANREEYAFVANTRALALIELNDLPTALSTINLALKCMPQLGPALCTRSEIQFKLGHYAESIADANKALQRMPLQDSSVGEVFYWRSCAERKLGQTTQADADLRKSAQLGYRPGSMRLTDDKNTPSMR
jgi:tetratricopeptide (TPR) repeat protein